MHLVTHTIHMQLSSGDIGIKFIIWIKHVFSCICRVPRKLFEHEADRLNVQTSHEDLASATIHAILVYGIMGNIHCESILKFWASGSGGDVI